MSGAALKQRRGHPKKTKLSEALAEDAPRLKARKGLIDKKATLIKAPGTDSEADVGEAFRPSDEQLAKINQFTRTAKTADEVVCFSTLSCNNIPDRDDDQFKTECVKGFAELEQPFAPTGKSFMLNHDYKIENAVGRIFDTDTKKVSGALFLTNDVYLPNTERYAGFIEDLDYGINWAVSVGVMLGSDECSLPWCKAPFSSWGWWCQNGHDKGLYYTEDAEEDSWGYPAPCDPKTKGAEKCLRLFSDPKDFYELSQVFLGAQYYAALEKEPGFATMMKSVAKGVPIIGLGSEDALAEKLPLPHWPDKVSEAFKRYRPKEAEDGSLVWQDENGLRWTFDPESPEDGVMSLGRATPTEEEGEEDSEQLEVDGTGDGNPAAGTSSGSVEDTGAGDGGSRQEGDQSSAGGEQPLGSEQGSAVDADEEEDDSEEEEDDSESEEESDDESKGVDAKVVIKSAMKAKLPESLRLAAADGLDALLSACAKHIREQAQKVSVLEPKAELGDKYVSELRAEAIAWYVKAHQEKDNAKVKTEAFEKLLDRAEGDAELLSEIIEEQKAAARAKFPKVLRSSFPSDPNEKGKLPGFDKGDPDVEEFGSETDQKVRRLHN